MHRGFIRFWTAHQDVEEAADRAPASSTRDEIRRQLCILKAMVERFPKATRGYIHNGLHVRSTDSS